MVVLNTLYIVVYNSIYYVDENEIAIDVIFCIRVLPIHKHYILEFYCLGAYDLCSMDILLMSNTNNIVFT